MKLEECLEAFHAEQVAQLEDRYSYYPSAREANVGSGAYGTVVLVRRRGAPLGGPIFAAKMMPRFRYPTDREVHHLHAEFTILFRCDGPNLNAGKELLHTSDSIIIILDTFHSERPDLLTRVFALLSKPNRRQKTLHDATSYVHSWGMLREEREVLAQWQRSRFDVGTFHEERLAELSRELGVLEEPWRGDLFQFVSRSPLPKKKAAIILRQCLLGLLQLHQNGFAHRDVKPENIIVELTRSAEPLRDPETNELRGVRFTERLQAQLCDFGLATAIEGLPVEAAEAPAIARTQTESALVAEISPLGTPLHTAPEVIRGVIQATPGGKMMLPAAEVEKIDIYSIGIVAFCMLYGKRPFHVSGTKKSLQTLHNAMMGGLPLDPTLDPSWRHLLQALTATDPKDRPTAREALDFEVFSDVGRDFTYEVCV